MGRYYVFSRSDAGRILATSTLIVIGAAACGDGEPVEETAAEPAAEVATAAQETPILFPDAPSPEVRRAVREAALDVEEGQATFYADKFEGRRTASGRTFRQGEMVAAHRAFPFGTRLRVTNTRNGNEVEVTVVDRGPFGQGSMRPVIDLSRTAAEQLDFIGAGRTPVRIEVLEWG